MKYFPALKEASGTSYSELLRQHEAVIDALNKALDAIAGAAPHCRDYMPIGHRTTAEIFMTAEMEHNSRFGKVERIRDEYAKSLQHIVEQHIERERMRGK